MASLSRRLQSLNPVIGEILDVSGAAGCSVGVLKAGEVVHQANFGYRDVEQKLPPDENTTYYIASLSKAFTAAALGVLVEEQKLDWSDVVSERLPAFQHQDETVYEKATLVDLLSHRSGLATKMTLWMGEESRILVKPRDFIKTTTYLERIYSLGSTYMSNNWCYGILGQLLERSSGQAFSTFLHERLFKPLGLRNTYVKRDDQTDRKNVALPYMWADNGPRLVPEPPIEVGGIYEGAVGVKSSITDLLTYYKAFMEAANDQEANGSSTSEGLPFTQVPSQIKPEIPITDVAKGSAATSYTLGWARSGLPSALDGTSMNKYLVKKLPLIDQKDKTSRDPVLLYHSGSLCGYLTSVILIPETNSAIVVLVNSLAKSDAADWVSRVLLEAMLNNGEVKTDYIALAKEAAKNTEDGFPNMHKELLEGRISGTLPLPLDEYVGKYDNAVHTFFIEIFSQDKSLFMTLNDDSHHYKWKLEHYHHNTWSWAIQYEDALTHALWPDPDKDVYLFEFRASSGSGIDQLIWRHDPDVPEGECFKKRAIANGDRSSADHNPTVSRKSEL